jgi:Fur family transcriptional regulator, peroxide stress response regulator
MTEKIFKRNSRQREVILDELKKMKSHPTATTLYNVVRERIPNISLGTVYRNLDLLSKKGIIRKLELGGTEARFDIGTDKHCHILCTECGRIDDVIVLENENNKIETIKSINGYQVSGYHINYYGICSDCLGNDPEESVN